MRVLLLSVLLLGTASCAWAPPPPLGHLTLSNFSYDRAHVEAVVTPYPDCAAHEGTAATDFMVPLNGTRVIDTPAGWDVCWRRELPPDAAPGAPQGAPQGAPRGARFGTPRWSEWNRAFLASGRVVDFGL